MRTYYESDLRKRILILSAVILAWSALLSVRLVQLQVVGHAEAKASVLKQAQSKQNVEAKRGTIFDRNGEILACSLPAVSVGIATVEGASPADERDRVRRLGQALRLTSKEMSAILERLLTKGSYTYARLKIPEEEAAPARALKLPKVEFEAASRRHYPKGSLAAHVLGGLNRDESVRAGVEARYDGVLRGKPGKQITFRDRKNRGYQTKVIEAPTPGGDIRLTIDTTIQYIAEKELARAALEHGIRWGTVIIMDPLSGELLALANDPTYNVEDFPSRLEAQRNLAVQASFEPGSTFKIVTAAAVRERDLVGFSDVFDCSAGSITIGRRTIRDHERFDRLTFPEVLIHSSNVGTVLFARSLSMRSFFETVKEFRFGDVTGIDLPAEENGMVHPFEKWNKKYSLPSISIGYEVSATALQVLRAMNVYATGGRLVRPHVVMDSPLLPPDPAPQILDKKIAAELVARVFEKVVEEGTAKAGRLEGYSIAGKTGTAQKLDPATGTYTTRKHTASFVGFVPASRPALTMIVVLDEPKEDYYYGGLVCAPVFRDIARQVLRYLRVPPDQPFNGPVVTASLGRREGP